MIFAQSVVQILSSQPLLFWVEDQLRELVENIKGGFLSCLRMLSFPQLKWSNSSIFLKLVREVIFYIFKAAFKERNPNWLLSQVRIFSYKKALCFLSTVSGFSFLSHGPVFLLSCNAWHLITHFRWLIHLMWCFICSHYVIDLFLANFTVIWFLWFQRVASD